MTWRQQLQTCQDGSRGQHGTSGMLRRLCIGARGGASCRALRCCGCEAAGRAARQRRCARRGRGGAATRAAAKAYSEHRPCATPWRFDSADGVHLDAISGVTTFLRGSVCSCMLQPTEYPRSSGAAVSTAKLSFVIGPKRKLRVWPAPDAIGLAPAPIPAARPRR